jgi:hypothetical protein
MNNNLYISNFNTEMSSFILVSVYMPLLMRSVTDAVGNFNLFVFFINKQN